MPTQFKDTKGRAWNVSFNVSVLKRVRDRLGVNLTRLVDDNFAEFMRVVGDPVLLCDVVFVMCDGQHPGVTDVDFGESMDGDTVQAAADCMYESMTNFSQSQLREPLRQLAKKGDAVRALAIGRADNRLMKFMAMDSEILLDAILSKTAIDLPESSELTPAN